MDNRGESCLLGRSAEVTDGRIAGGVGLAGRAVAAVTGLMIAGNTPTTPCIDSVD
jgi:hypothetical protein